MIEKLSFKLLHYFLIFSCKIQIILEVFKFIKNSNNKNDIIIKKYLKFFKNLITKVSNHWKIQKNLSENYLHVYIAMYISFKFKEN